MDRNHREHDSSDAARLTVLARSLPQDVTPESDLWPRIAAVIDTAEERAVRELPRSTEPARDLWSGIAAGIDRQRSAGATKSVRPHQRFGAAASIGVAVIGVLATLVSVQIQRVGAIDGAIPDDEGLPALVTEALEQFSGAVPGTPGAELQATALEIERDLLMTRSERLRIEQAMAAAVNDRNLRTQWRHVYRVELRLIDEAQQLRNIPLNRREI